VPTVPGARMTVFSVLFGIPAGTVNDTLYRVGVVLIVVPAGMSVPRMVAPASVACVTTDPSSTVGVVGAQTDTDAVKTRFATGAAVSVVTYAYASPAVTLGPVR
jgi:hypothetical protein